MQRGDLFGEAKSLATCGTYRLRERPDPRGQSFGRVDSERRESADVCRLIGGQDQAHRRHVVDSEPSAAEHDVDQASSDASIAISEGMDRLELGVGDGGLRHSRKVVAVDERA